MFLKVLCSKFKKLKQVQLPAIQHRFTMTCTTENRHQHIQIKWILSSFTVSLFMQSWKRRVCLFHLCRHRKSVKLSSKSLSNSLSEGQERHLWGLRCTHLWQRWIIEQRNWTHVNIETNCPCGLQLGLFGLHMISVNHFFHREMVHFGLRQQGNQMCYFLPRSFHSRCTSGERTCSEGTFVSQKSQSVPLLKRMLRSSAPMYSSYFHVSLSMIIRWSLLSMPCTPSMKKKRALSSSVAMTNCAAADDVGFVTSAIIIQEKKKKSIKTAPLTCFCSRVGVCVKSEISMLLDCKCAHLLWIIPMSLFPRGSLWKILSTTVISLLTAKTAFVLLFLPQAYERQHTVTQR